MDILEKLQEQNPQKTRKQKISGGQLGVDMQCTYGTLQKLDTNPVKAERTQFSARHLIIIS